MNNELYHHGILGMKWGVRRYQNKDGSLTQAGKKRYGYESMSNEELRSAVNRKIMENRYNQLRSNTGKYKESKDNLDLASTAAKTAGSVSTAFGKAYELDGRNKEKNISNFISTSANNLSKTFEEAKKNVTVDSDFSNVSDEELKAVVERMDLEQRYTKYYGTQTENTGRENAQAMLETLGAVAGLAATGLGIALTIKKLKES